MQTRGLAAGALGRGANPPTTSWPALPSGSWLGLGIPGRASRDDRLDLAYEPDDAPLEARALPVCAERNTLVHLTGEQHPDPPGH